MEKHILSCKSDRISKLPVEVKDIILTFLPLREAVRTSILSTKWRHVWINLSKLVFDNTVSKSQDNEPLTRYKLISTINQILLLHDGPIHKFSLSHSVIQSCPEIDNFTIFLSKNCVREFSLEILKGEKHKLHSSFFFCRELTHLNLCDCVFTPPPAFKAFPKLVSVKFVNVDFCTDMFGNFVSSWPQLETMTLINPPKFDCLPISAPNLKFLQFYGNCESLCFGDAPVLQVISFNIYEMRISQDEETCRFVEFFRCLPALKKLVTNYNLLQHLAAGVAPVKLPSSIGLEIVELSMISFNALDELSSIFCLIRSCPTIKKIIIEIYDDHDDVKIRSS